MKKNVGKVDMIIRLIVGIIIAVVGSTYHSWWGLVAILPILTAFVNFCPLYTVLGCSTNKAKE